MSKYKQLEEMKESVQGLMGTEVQNKTSNNAEACPLVAVKGTADTGYDTSVSVLYIHTASFSAQFPFVFSDPINDFFL